MMQLNRETTRLARKLGLPVTAMLLSKNVLQAKQRRIDPITRARILAVYQKLVKIADEAPPEPTSPVAAVEAEQAAVETPNAG